MKTNTLKVQPKLQPILHSLLFLFTTLVAGCAENYSFNSNLNAKSVDDYFKAGNVLLVEKNQDPPQPFNPLGMVDGESCQLYANQPPASFIEARTNMRVAAANKGGNGVILNNCVSYKDPEAGCLTRVLCIGQAISIIKPPVHFINK